VLEKLKVRLASSLSLALHLKSQFQAARFCLCSSASVTAFLEFHIYCLQTLPTPENSHAISLIKFNIRHKEIIDAFCSLNRGARVVAETDTKRRRSASILLATVLLPHHQDRENY
jgi:hypothetical protein